MSDQGERARELSDGFAAAVAFGSRFTVMVDGREGYPSSGVVYKPGFVLSSNHTVTRNDGVNVAFSDGSRSEGSIAGRDPGHDLVLIKLAEELGEEPARIERKLQTGDLTLSLARPTDEGIQATLGMVSIASGRYHLWRSFSAEGVMRTDAAHFPGFSGGPVVDVEGRLAGINVLGMRFGSPITLPVDMVWEVAKRLEEHGSVQQGYLGIRSQPVEVPAGVEFGREQDVGLLIVSVDEESPAAKAGLIVGDIVLALDGAPVTDHEVLLSALSSESVGKEIGVEIIRAGKVESLRVTIGGRTMEEWWPHHGHGPGPGHRPGPPHGPGGHRPGPPHERHGFPHEHGKRRHRG